MSNSMILAFCLILLTGIPDRVFAQVDPGALGKHWVLLSQEQEKDLNDPTRSAGYYDEMSIEQAIRQKKDEMLGLLELIFSANGVCEITEYGRTRKEKYEWSQIGELLLIGRRSYRVLELNDRRLVMQDHGNTLINLTYRYLPKTVYDGLPEDELLAFTHYDSLVLRRALERRKLRERKELYNRLDYTPKYIEDWDAFEALLQGHFGDRYIPWHQPYQGAVETTKLSFVVEKDSTVSLIGTEVSNTQYYEEFQRLIRETNGKWLPARYNFLPAPGLLEFVIKLKVRPE
jgi:hypothetical protein